MSDELPTAARVSDPGIRALYRQENRWQAWLDVEAALAKAQAELGIIPQPAAFAAASRCPQARNSIRTEILVTAAGDRGWWLDTGSPPFSCCNEDL